MSTLVRRATSGRRGQAVLAGSWLVPATCSVIALVCAGARYHPNADIALIELHVRDVGSEEVLLGPYSRFGWSHPGPMLYYLLALPYRLLGSSSAGIVVGSVLVNTGALVGITAIGWRRGGPVVGALTFALSGLMVRALGPQFLRDPWNPHLPLLPFALLVLTAWSLAVGKRWALPATGVLGSLVVQSHIGYAPVTVVVAVVAVLGFVRSRPTGWLAPAALSCSVLGVLWLPPVLEQLLHQPGNLRALVDYYSDDHATGGLAQGLRAVTLQLGPAPEWLVGRRPVNAFTGAIELPSTSVPVAVLPAVLSGLLAKRRGWRDITWLAALVAALAVTAVVSVSRVVGDLLPYLTVWTWVVGLMAWLLVGATAARWVGEVRPGVDRPLAFWSAVVGVVLLVVNSVAAARAGTPTGDESRIVGELAADVRANLHDEVDVVHLQAEGSLSANSYADGLALQLERAGRRVEVGPEQDAKYGRHRVGCTGGAATLLVTVNEEVSASADDHDLELVGRASALPLAERDARVRAVERARASSSSAEELYRRVAALPRPGSEVAVYRGDPRRCGEPPA